MGNRYGDQSQSNYRVQLCNIRLQNVCLFKHISSDSIKTFQNLGVNISKTVRYKTIKCCICLEINVINRWYKFHNHTPNSHKMAGHRKLQVRFCNIIDSWHQTVWRHRYRLSDVGCQHVKMSRCQSVTFQYDMRDAICFK